MSLTKSPQRIVDESASPLVAIPDGWPRRPLGEVASIVNGCAFSSNEFVANAGKPLIRIRDIFNDSTAVGYVGRYEARYLVQRDELLVGMDGDFNCSRWRGPEGLLNQRVCKVAPAADALDVDFLTFVLPGYLRAIHDVTSSQTVAHLSSRDVAQIPIPVPALEVQRRVVALLNSALASQESSLVHLSAASRALERLRRAVLSAACSGRLTADWRIAHADAVTPEHALFERDIIKRVRRANSTVDLQTPPVPATYVMTTLGACAERIDYGTSKLCDAPEQSGVAVLRMGNVQDGKLDLSDLKYCERDGEIERLMLRDGDLLFNRTNSPELVGKSAVVHADMPLSFASYLIRVRFAVDLADPDYICYWINSAWGREWARLAKTDGVSQSNINGTKLAAMPLPLPPIEEQREIVIRASQMLRIADGLSEHVRSASTLVERTTQAILAKTFRGELTEATGSAGAK